MIKVRRDSGKTETERRERVGDIPDISRRHYMFETTATCVKQVGMP